MHTVLRLRFATPVLSLVEGLTTNDDDGRSPFALRVAARKRREVEGRQD